MTRAPKYLSIFAAAATCALTAHAETGWNAPDAFSGTVKNPGADGAVFTNVLNDGKTICLANGTGTLNISVQADFAQAEALTQDIRKRNAAADAWEKLPFSATDKEEESAFDAFVSKDDQTQIDQSLGFKWMRPVDFKRMLRETSATVFSESDAKHLLPEELQEAAEAMNKAMSILRREAFIDIPAQNSAPSSTFNASNALKLLNFSYDLISAFDTYDRDLAKKPARSGKPTKPDIAAIFRDKALDYVDLHRKSFDITTAIAFGLGEIGDRLSGPHAPQNPRAVIQKTVNEVSSAGYGVSIPVRMTYNSEPSCAPDR